MTLGDFRKITETYGDEVMLSKAESLARADYADEVERVVIEIRDTPGQGTSTAIILI